MQVNIRPLRQQDRAQWQPLWDAYNAFYGREGASALDARITSATWERFFDREEPVHAIVAVAEDRIVGLCHYLFHRSTTRLTDVCYLQDLFTEESFRGRGVGRALIQRVSDEATVAGSSRLYWTTQTSNRAGRALYDKMAEYRGFIVYSRELGT